MLAVFVAHYTRRPLARSELGSKCIVLPGLFIRQMALHGHRLLQPARLRRPIREQLRAEREQFAAVPMHEVDMHARIRSEMCQLRDGGWTEALHVAVAGHELEESRLGGM